MITRRDWAKMVACWVASTWAPTRASAFLQAPRFTSDPFAHGVASGDPLPTGVVLWTRLTADILQDNVEVDWEVASDDQMRRVVKSGRAVARPDFAHSVHVEVDGLEPARWYHYRFRAGGVTSPVGRTRTAPAPGAPVSRLNFAFASCQNFERGLYTAYRHLVNEDIELLVFLGDFIYEGGARPGRVRQHSSGEVRTLAEYRARYAQYQSDALLREARRLFPWIVVWDDHEVANDWAGDSPEWSVPDPNFMMRRAHAAKAFYENMPLRRASLPDGPNIRIHRRFDYGDLARFHMLDTRQFRSRQACGGGFGRNCAEINDPARTMLGAAQEQWLEDGLRQSAARWNIIGNQIGMTKVDLEPGPGESFETDIWGGYEAARRRLTDFLAASKPSGAVVITGNNHYHFVGDLKSNYRNEQAPAVATELLGTAISSTGDPQDSPFVQRWNDALRENPQVKYFEQKPGYVVCALDRETCHADFRVVPFISTPGAPLETSARFILETRTPGAARL